MNPKLIKPNKNLEKNQKFSVLEDLFKAKNQY
jgi:hypothetical protein